MNPDPKDDIIQKQSRAIVYLALIIGLLLICVFVLAYCKPADKPGECGVSSMELKKEPVCGMPGMEADNTEWAARELGITDYDRNGSQLFKQNCAVCHSVGTLRLTGPGLKDVHLRVPKPTADWLRNYILNNEKVRRSGDAYAKKLAAENDGAAMTVFEGQLTEKQVNAIIVYMVGWSR
ncbi:MAG: cytochrome c [Bacteroidetes bacterium]|nr:cytochrome c [Bacteroidota bacterium]